MTEAYDRYGFAAATALEPPPGVDPEPGKDTKNRILDAAESLFVAHGFQGTSLRRITALAGVNLAAVNYHFRSKEQLILSVMGRKLEPVNRRRLELLDELERKEAGGKALTVEAILAAFLEPVVAAQAAGIDLGSFPVLMGRLYAEPGGLFQKMLSSVFSIVARRFKEALVRALPEASPIDVLWGMHLTIGAMSHYLARPPVMTLLAGRDVASTDDPAEVLDRLVAYMAGGFHALVSRKESGR
jgi:AcrR family transcriptional regulator